ncbi:MAG: hypothetical protein WCS35_07360 [Sphaerochaeta sp.]
MFETAVISLHSPQHGVGTIMASQHDTSSVLVKIQHAGFTLLEKLTS